MNNFREYNFDGLVGPTHNYAGLGSGNLASMASKDYVSNPRAAALEGLAKMRLLAEMSVPQAVLPPQRRPHLDYLRTRGYGADDAPAAALLRKAAEDGDAGRRDLAIASSASAMWAANAATVSPSPDTADGRCHFTIANLVSQPHRALEAAERYEVFLHLFGDMRRFDVHRPLHASLPDEGAANHTRLCESFGMCGFEIFTAGPMNGTDRRQRTFPPRQSPAASLKVADYHQQNRNLGCSIVEQWRGALDAGVFHNDVICVGNANVLLIHSDAWQNHHAVLGNIRHLTQEWHPELEVLTVRGEEFPLADAVRSYLFNSQIVTLPSGGMALVYPAECDAVPSAKAAVERILREDNPVERAVRVDVRQSMNNGGGPACLRLRVVLSDEERAAVRGNVFWTPQLHETLEDWVRRHYRAALSPADLADVRLFEESERALDELAGILELPI